MEKKIKIKIKRMKTTILGCTKTDRFLAKSHKAYLTPIGMPYKSKENAYLQRHLVTFSSDPMYLAGWQGVKLTKFMSIFTSKSNRKLSIKDQLTKSNPKRKRSEKGLPSCQLGLIKFLRFFLKELFCQKL